jgi:uncharacterized SAM-binding protein YcdF (DUF218 family)
MFIFHTIVIFANALILTVLLQRLTKGVLSLTTTKQEFPMFLKMFSYMTFPAVRSDEVKPAYAAIVFGRKDPRLAIAAADLYYREKVEHIVVTGGVGKDSGDLKVPEAEYLAAHLRAVEVQSSKIAVEPSARNGGENCRFSMALLSESLPTDIVLVCHATSGRRVLELFKFEAQKFGFGGNLQLVVTGYPFDQTNQRDQEEVCAEILRLADWPGKSFLASDLAPPPAEMVAFARAFQNK